MTEAEIAANKEKKERRIDHYVHEFRGKLMGAGHSAVGLFRSNDRTNKILRSKDQRDLLF